MNQSGQPEINVCEISAFKIPTEMKESDGTLEWEETVMVLVSLEAGGNAGIGFTYADASAANFIVNNFPKIILGQNPLNIEQLHHNMHKSIRNNGNCGIAFMALSAVDIALWDLKAKLLNLPLANLLGQRTESIQVYGSGGFTSYSEKELTQQFENWVEQGFKQVKMKIGREPSKDIERIRIARESIRPETALFVDANGAFTVKQAIKTAGKFEKYNVEWFEEPVSSDNLDGLSFVKNHVPAGVNIAAGEYGYDLPYFRKLVESEAIDVLQADATRCGGITGFLKAGHLAEAYHLPFSFHCAPSVHLHAALSLPGFFTGEYFFDHVKIEERLFDGFKKPDNGYLSPDLSMPGLGLQLKTTEAEKYKIFHKHLNN